MSHLNMRPLALRTLFQRCRLPRDIVRTACERYRTRTAMVGSESRRTFAEVEDRVLRLAEGWRALRLRSRDHVFTLLPDGMELIEARLAAYELGAVLTSIHPRSSAKQVLDAVRLVRPSILIYDPRIGGSVPEQAAIAMPSLQLIATGRGSRYETMIATCPPGNSRNRIDPTDPAQICFTAGTSGEPKGVVTSHRAIENGARMTAAAMGITSEDVLLTTVPLVGSGNTILLPSLLSGSTLVALPSDDTRELLEAIRRHRVTQLFMTPSQLIDFLDYPGLDRQTLGSVRKITCGTDRMPASKLEEAIRRFGPIFQQSYDMAEAFAPLALLEPEEQVRGGEPASRAVLNSTGSFVPGVEFRIVNEQDRCVEANMIGEVMISSPMLFTEYWRRPVLTERVLRNRWLRTGDLGYLDTEGRVHIVDQRTDLIESSGRLICPRIVEEAAHRHPAVKEACLVKGSSASHSVLFVSLRQAWTNTDAASVADREILEFLRSQVQPRQMPGNVQILKELPRCLLGKVLRRELRDTLLKDRIAVAS